MASDVPSDAPISVTEPAAAGGAHEALRARVRAFVARRVPASDVDDVVQDVFVRMLRGVAGLRDEERFDAWVLQIARSAIAESQRARARHPLTREAPADDAAAEPTSDEMEADARLAAAAGALVAMLPSPYREALTLTEIEGLTQKSAAEQLGVSVSGMKSRVQRGRAQLRTLLHLCCEIALDVRGHVIGCESRPRTPEAHAAALAELAASDEKKA